MEVNIELKSLKQFEFATVSLNGVDYLKLYSYPDQLSELTEISVVEFEDKYQKQLLHFKSLLTHCYKQYIKVVIDVASKVNNRTLTFDSCKDILYREMIGIMDQCQLEHKIITNKVGIYSLNLFQDFIEEILRRIEEIENFFSILKPYTIMDEVNPSDFSSLEDHLKQEIDPHDWNEILLQSVDENDIITTNIISLKPRLLLQNKSSKETYKVRYEQAIRPEAKEDFEKFYYQFCIDEPQTENLEIILFFKLMNKQGYFIQEFNTQQLFEITIDRTRKEIAYNYFKNNGRKKFEDWLDGKPLVPIFKSNS